MGAASARDLRARRRRGARRCARLGSAVAAPPERRRERRRARGRSGDAQGEHRHRGNADAARHRRHRARPRAARRAAGGAAARGGRGDPRQDDDARLRDAVVGPVELPRPDAQPVGSEQEPGRQQLRRGRRCRGGLRAAPRRHRHRRLGATARRVVRHLHAQAEPRPDPDRSALRRARRRPDDAHRRRRRAPDGRPLARRRSRHDEPAGGSRSNGSASSATSPGCASAC